MKPLIFHPLELSELLNLVKSSVNKDRYIFNFLNMHDIYQYTHETQFRKTFEAKENFNFFDGFFPALYLSLIHFKRLKRTSGPTFTRSFFSDKKLSSSLKHFFIIANTEDLKEFQKRFPHVKSVYGYSPPFVKGISFDKEEITKMANMINKSRPDVVWVGLGCPKQNILASQLFAKTKNCSYANVGAALDFLLEKKKEAPKIIRSLGIEWLYRLVTDFKHSKAKVVRSFRALWSLRVIRLKK